MRFRPVAIQDDAIKTIGRQFTQFPETDSEADAWKPTISVRALARRVLCVAVTRIEGRWKAYVDAVEGKSHEAEASEVIRQGVPLPASIAAAVFPEFKEVPYAR